MYAGCAGKTVRSLENACHTWAPKMCVHDEALYKFTFTFTLLILALVVAAVVVVVIVLVILVIVVIASCCCHCCSCNTPTTSRLQVARQSYISEVSHIHLCEWRRSLENRSTDTWQRYNIFWVHQLLGRRSVSHSHSQVISQLCKTNWKKTTNNKIMTIFHRKSKYARHIRQ